RFSILQAGGEPMKRAAGVWLVTVALGGCMSADHGPAMPGPGCGGGFGGAGCAPTVPGVQGPWGQPVAMAAPYSAAPASGEALARAMMSQSVPLDLVQASGATGAGSHSGLMQASASMSMGGPSP